MKGKIVLFWLVLIGGAGAFLFQTAYQVQGLEEELNSLNRQIVREQESIQILKAEWSYLNTPTRLEKLAREYLQLQPSEARQFVAKADAVPMRPEQQPIASEIIRAPRLPVAMPVQPTAPVPAAMPATAQTAPAHAGPAHATTPALIPAAAPAPAKAPKTTGATALASIPSAGPAAVVAPRAAQPVATVRPPQPSAPAATKPQNPAPSNQRAAPQPASAGRANDDPMGMLIARLGGAR